MAAMASTDKYSVRLGTSGHIKLKKAVLVSFLGSFSTYHAIRPGDEWRVIARAHTHTCHILFSCAIISRLNFA